VTEYRFRVALRTFLGQRPFRPFVIEMMNGRRLRIEHPETIYLRDGTAVFHPIEDKPRPYLFDHESVCLMYEPEESSGPQ
jgi:hypothetical protein